jgi:hypothetical protein
MKRSGTFQRKGPAISAKRLSTVVRDYALKKKNDARHMRGTPRVGDETLATILTFDRKISVYYFDAVGVRKAIEPRVVRIGEPLPS